MYSGMRSKKKALLYCSGKGDAGEAGANQPVCIYSICRWLESCFPMNILGLLLMLSIDCVALSYVVGN